MYQVKEIFLTLQGEGTNAGRAAIFCRFAGCNLWSGREDDRASAVCRFCDTDFVGTGGVSGGKFATAELLVRTLVSHWRGGLCDRLVVLTGGEPMLQVDDALVSALHGERFEIAIETNGTLPVPRAIDWICVSPKSGADLVQRSGDELKLVYPQPGLMPEAVEGLEFNYRYLQPMDGPDAVKNTAAAVAYCREHPQWRLSLQTHKLIGIP
ncbi:MAG: 7-carboxy-7-deazaguanine synthase [Alphaproteobacteria bacterium]|nr:7-carboxy-7-deazaguanine synthase [Alphaproteobacteria bacterium]